MSPNRISSQSGLHGECPEATLGVSHFPSWTCRGLCTFNVSGINSLIEPPTFEEISQADDRENPPVELRDEFTFVIGIYRGYLRLVL